MGKAEPAFGFFEFGDKLLPFIVGEVRKPASERDRTADSEDPPISDTALLLGFGYHNALRALVI